MPKADYTVQPIAGCDSLFTRTIEKSARAPSDVAEAAYCWYVASASNCLKSSFGIEALVPDAKSGRGRRTGFRRMELVLQLSRLPALDIGRFAACRAEA